MRSAAVVQTSATGRFAVECNGLGVDMDFVSKVLSACNGTWPFVQPMQHNDSSNGTTSRTARSASSTDIVEASTDVSISILPRHRHRSFTFHWRSGTGKEQTVFLVLSRRVVVAGSVLCSTDSIAVSRMLSAAAIQSAIEEQAAVVGSLQVV